MNAFEYVMKKNRVSFPRVRAPQENYVRIFDLAIRTRPPARSEDRRQTGDAGSMSSTVAAVDVVRAHHAAHKFLRCVVHFINGFRATEHPEIAVVLLPDGSSKGRRPAPVRG